MQNDNVKFKEEFKKRLYNFVLKLVKFIDGLPRDNVTRVVGDQLLRSGTGILGTYIEATAASSRRDFTNYFNHSLKSTNESKLWVALLKDTGRATEDVASWFLNELDEISKVFASSILTLKGRK